MFICIFPLQWLLNPLIDSQFAVTSWLTGARDAQSWRSQSATRLFVTAATWTRLCPTRPGAWTTTSSSDTKWVLLSDKYECWHKVSALLLSDKYECWHKVSALLLSVQIWVLAQSECNALLVQFVLPSWI